MRVRFEIGGAVADSAETGHVVQLLGPQQYGLKIDHPEGCRPWDCSLYTAMITHHREVPADRYRATPWGSGWTLEPIGWPRPEDHAAALRAAAHSVAWIAATKVVEKAVRDSVGAWLATHLPAMSIAGAVLVCLVEAGWSPPGLAPSNVDGG